MIYLCWGETPASSVSEETEAAASPEADASPATEVVSPVGPSTLVPLGADAIPVPVARSPPPVAPRRSLRDRRPVDRLDL